MSEKYTFLAFLNTLWAIVILTALGALMSSRGQDAEALGIGAAVIGLIGVIGTFKPRSAQDNQEVTVTNTRADPVPTDPQGE